MKQDPNYSAISLDVEDFYDQAYWDKRWKNQDIGWDVGYPTPVFTQFIDLITDKSISILIPGCGNAYEAKYLLEKGFTNVTLIDISPQAIKQLKERFDSEDVTILCEDFFTHHGKYDLIFEQTFFCAISPHRREEYAQKMHELLTHDGVLFGVLFNKQFPNSFPPFGGNLGDYIPIFEPYFHIKKMETCYNSIAPRHQSELFMHLVRK